MNWDDKEKWQKMTPLKGKGADQIRIDPETGSFGAIVADQLRTSKELKKIEKLVAGQQRAVAAIFKHPSYRDSIELYREELVAYERGRWRNKLGRLEQERTEYLHADPEIVAELEALAAAAVALREEYEQRRRDLRDQRDAVYARARPVEPADLKVPPAEDPAAVEEETAVL